MGGARDGRSEEEGRKLTLQAWVSLAEVEFDGFYLRQVAMLRVMVRVAVSPAISKPHRREGKNKTAYK